jgi:hypothetical protein
MCIRSKIILLALLITSCKKIDKNEFDVPHVDTALVRSEYNTKRFNLIINDVDSFELYLWTSVGNKIDSLIDENDALKKRLNWRPQIIDKDGNVKKLPTIEELRKRRKK